MEVNLTQEQKEYVEAYNKILNRLSDIQLRIDDLKKEADETVLALNQLRRKEQLMFPENESQ
tara:strand:- start:389 stop:574 length:186 start_codon:yes stop_codon:yes gene_type:complete